MVTFVTVWGSGKALRGTLRLLSCAPLVRALSLGALLAATKEVVEDVAPGGHRGAVLLALQELCETLEAAGVRLFGLVPLLMEAPPLRLLLAGGAALFAALELGRDLAADGFRLGGHHGVALLALCRLLKEGVPFAQRLARAAAKPLAPSCSRRGAPP